MQKVLTLLLLGGFLISQAQQDQHNRQNTNKFRQMYDLMATPNMYRTASGAPGPEYYQQQADYKIDVVLDDQNARLYGSETITYHNNAKESLDYLWIQLDQNINAKDSQTPLARNDKVSNSISASAFSRTYFEDSFDGGFKIEQVIDAQGKNLPYTINHTMMRIDLEKPLKHGEKYSFSIKWWYNINNYMEIGGRSGYEHFSEDGNNLYVLAQFHPRMAVYNDVEGWQNMQFWGGGEFALPFGNFDVSITVPADHFLDATGSLMNREEVYTKDQLKRYKQAEKSFENPVVIITQAEATEIEKGRSKKTKTWKFRAENVRDFGISTSRKFISDAMAVKINDKIVMAVSLYPKEGNPLWEKYSTRAVAHTLKSYSSFTFDYPYPKAISVNAQDQGMEYPMICWNFGRPEKDGTYSDNVKYGMLGVIIHEVGHNFFPMIVNSDERQWTWMDEGLNTFLEYLTEQSFDPNFPSRRGPAKNIIPYMSGDPSGLEPIMSNSENIRQFGNNAYAKPATALNILRNTIMGQELFDHAFRTYSKRWKFKHPTPEDFFRTMEDASAVDLDWFWRGWFYTTDYNDIGIKSVQKFHVTDKAPKNVEIVEVTRRNRKTAAGPLVYMANDEMMAAVENSAKALNLKDVQTLNEFLSKKFTNDERKNLKNPKFFYEVTFNKPGGLVMPILVELTFTDGTSEMHRFPAQIWKLNDDEVSRTFATEKEISKILIDPKLETADVDTENNVWPREIKKSKFD